MRLLLDEHLSPEIARQLRGLGHDLVHFALAPDQRRTIVTRDLGDYRPLLVDALRRGATTYGLVCVPSRFSLSRKGIGRLVGALDALLTAHPSDDAAVRVGGELWVGDPEGG